MEPRWWGLWKTGLLDPPPWAFYLRCHGVLSAFPPLSLDLFSFFFLAMLHSLCWRRKWQPTPVFLPGESQGQGSLVGFHLWGHTESDTTEVT